MSIGYYQLASGNVAAIEADCPFPPLENALTEPNGLLAIGGDLSATRLIAAYKQGIFPWYSDNEPVMWWSPNPRMVLFPDELKVARSLKKVINQQPYTLKINTAFESVINACAKTPRPNQDGTWIMPEMINAYTKLYKKGFAHSIEAWQGEQLVGGCYGLKIGKMFYGESMFHLAPNASKIAFVHLVQWLKQAGVSMIDCQMNTPLLASFGAREISRKAFMLKLTKLINDDTT